MGACRTHGNDGSQNKQTIIFLVLLCHARPHPTIYQLIVKDSAHIYRIQPASVTSLPAGDGMNQEKMESTPAENSLAVAGS